MKVLKISHPDSGSCCIKAEDMETKVNNPLDIVMAEVRTLIEEGSSGDSITIELGEATEREYEELPEFMGW